VRGPRRHPRTNASSARSTSARSRRESRTGDSPKERHHGHDGNSHREGFLGEKAVPADAYYGVQTLRGKEKLLHHRHPLNVMQPVITFALFTSLATMEHAVDSLRIHRVDGITANAERTRDMVLNSLGIVTLLKPSLGYKQCAEIAREGYETGKSLYEIVVRERKLMTQAKWDELFSFESLIAPKFEQ
jgi:aspartate ammonia-lyase